MKKNNAEKVRKPKVKLKQYQKIMILCGLTLVVIATIILLVMFKQYIFSSQTWTIIVMILVIALVAGISAFGWYIMNGKE